ncbi:hypothetical protein [Actinokineospora bangkokensis]|uniref:Uncharacterized protein n=1 Tax=Actinokineospora bangkokensis TaxID=1193682 RepID=A0A1Q9LTY8_9PSEU|nr:hypothetical protein [Actinokineospora bangkokensis]OLR95469.1 hypothetical protein BJP25_06945 [Actinokineospora bangkokensis]
MLSEQETAKDVVQEIAESTAEHVGRIAQIITGAVVGVIREIGDLASEVFEVREAGRRAVADRPPVEE